MPVAKLSTPKPVKKSASKKSKTFKVKLQLPGHDPEILTVKNGATVGDVSDAKNLSSYELSINAEKVKSNHLLAANDLIRVAVKPKHGK